MAEPLCYMLLLYNFKPSTEAGKTLDFVCHGNNITMSYKTTTTHKSLVNNLTLVPPECIYFLTH